jgi:L-iditol 2-dehydrogenase
MGFSDYMLAPACCAVPYEGLKPEVAALTECAGVGYDLVKTADIQMGDRVALVGPGPIGLVAAALAKQQAPSRLLVVGHTAGKKRLQFAKDLGAEALALDGSLADCKDLHRQFDHVLMTAPVKHIEPALSLLAYGGEMSYIGIGTGDGRISFDANDFHFRKLQLRASFASPAIYFPAVLRLLKAGVIPGEKLVSHVFKLGDISKAMTLCRDDKAGVLKVVIAN